MLDIKATAKKISEQWGDGISIIATSFGAGPSIIYTAQNRDKVKCLVLLCPALDYDATFLNPIVPWVKEFINEESLKHLDEKGYISLDDVFKLGAKLIEEFKIIRPYEFLKEIKCPILTIHGNKDTMAPYEISQKYGVPNDQSEFITIDGADHGFVAFGDETGEHKESKENKIFVINKIIDWIEKWGV
ncbi:hypothetical protein M1N92_02195 [Dehalococcoidia bacterium]|nr:hypothetical protein [Dehalococcoidia bacterium]